jgi:glycerophosphoryl diester phosphodiesterase
MLDRSVVTEFIFEQFKEVNLRIPKSVKKQELVEAFCQFTEDDYYEWLKDNFKTFFNHYNPDWIWIKNYIEERKKES